MELTFVFTVEEVNSILQALGNRPYAEVQALISKIKIEGDAQIAASSANEAASAAAETK